MVWSGREPMEEGQGGATTVAPVKPREGRRCDCEPFCRGEVHAEKPMEWASDARCEPCELVNLCSQDLSQVITTSLDASNTEASL